MPPLRGLGVNVVGGFPTILAPLRGFGDGALLPFYRTYGVPFYRTYGDTNMPPLRGLGVNVVGAFLQSWRPDGGYHNNAPMGLP